RRARAGRGDRLRAVRERARAAHDPRPRGRGNRDGGPGRHAVGGARPVLRRHGPRHQRERHRRRTHDRRAPAAGGVPARRAPRRQQPRHHRGAVQGRVRGHGSRRRPRLGQRSRRDDRGGRDHRARRDQPFPRVGAGRATLLGGAAQRRGCGRRVTARRRSLELDPDDRGCDRGGAGAVDHAGAGQHYNRLDTRRVDRLQPRAAPGRREPPEHHRARLAGHRARPPGRVPARRRALPRGSVPPVRADRDRQDPRDLDGAAVTEPRVHLVPALDGVRGVAVGLVVLFHLRPDLLPGGWVGMSIFFSLSGFLITRLLLTEVQRDGTVSLRRFWIRRARRLLPALYALLAAVAVVLVVHGTWTARVRGATWSSLLYVNNWWQLHHATDYWAQFDTTRPPFEHLWSLSVEEQFYVAWPLVVFAATRWARRPLAAIGVAATVITVWGVAFGLAMAHFGWGGMTAQYYNTFVRAAELLAGGLLAVVLAARPDLWSTARARRHLDLIACVLLAVLVGVSVVLD